MATLSEIKQRARIELLEPRAQRPSSLYLLQTVTTNIQCLLNELVNTGRPWVVGEFLLTIGPNATEIVVPVGDEVGKVLEVLTYAPHDPDHIEEIIPCYELQRLAWDFNLPRSVDIPYSNSGHSAQRIAFYRKEGVNQLYAQIRPLPQETATYKVLYSVGQWAETAALEESPLLPQHHHLVVCQTALDALPAAEWWDDEKMNRDRRAELRASLEPRIEKYSNQFRRHIRSITSPGQSRRRTYAID